MRAFLPAILALISWTTRIAAYYGIDEHAKAAYFNFDNGEYVFAMNPTANGDIYFHMSGPATHCWIGAGFGTEMKDALMFVAYPGADGHHLTVSARIGNGHSEPVHEPAIEVFGVFNDTYAPNAMTVTDTGTLIAHGACRNCTKWATGELDLDNTAQPMLFALGPGCPLRSDDLAASIPLHRTYGRYTMNLRAASNQTGWYGRVPGPNIPDFIFPPTDAAFVSQNTDVEFDVHNMKNIKAPIHAALMCIAFLLIFPAGSLILIFMKKVLVHAALQTVGLVIVIASFGIGASMSGLYNKSKNFNSAHQGLGLLIVAALLIQLALGLTHHARYNKTSNPTLFGKIHFFLGPSLMALGLINAGIGFNFAGRPNLNIPYGIAAAVCALLFFGLIGCLLCFKQRRRYRPDHDTPITPFPAPQTPGGYHDGSPEVPGPYYNQDFELNRQPTYGSQPPEAYEPTTPYSPGFAQGPYTPVSAYTPATPRTWRKEEVTSYARQVDGWEEEGAGGGRWGSKDGR